MEIYITVKVLPGARISQIRQGIHTDLICSVTAMAQDDKANEAVIRLLAERLGCPRRDILIVAGRTARIKRLKVQGYTCKQELWDILDIPVQNVLRDMAGR